MKTKTKNLEVKNQENYTFSTSSFTLYEYNELGQQIRTAQDINSNGTIDLAGSDRVTESDSYYEEINSDYWMTSVSKIYAQANSSAVTTNSIRRNRLTGLSAAKTSESLSIDILGNETISTTSIDRSNKVRIGLMSTPDSILVSTNTTVNGLQVSSTTKTGLEYTYAYDSLGRRTGTTDPRIGESITHYNAKGQVDYTEDAATNRTSYAYDADTGRRIAVTNALDEATLSHYSPEGQLLGTFGNTYPVFYEYDSYDRMSAMYTLRDTNIVVNSYSSFMNNKSSFDRTSWLYDEATGLLTNKVYDDGKGPTYTYYPNGQLYTRTWARGVTSTYTYAISGELTRTDYSEDMRSVVKVYNRLGQQTKGIHEYFGAEFSYYDQSTLLLTYKAIHYMGILSKYIYYSYDSKGRNTGYKFSASYEPSSASLSGAAYTFDDYGRVATVDSIVGSETNTFHYNYLQDSAMISSITNNLGFNVTKSYEPNRNLIVGVSNYFGSSSVSSFEYQNDAIGRRTERLDFDENLFAITNSFAYNGYSELTNAIMNTDNYNFTFDDIGNREEFQMNTTSVDYGNSELNQCLEANSLNPAYDKSFAFDLDGNMLTNGDWTYTWNGENRMVSASNTVDDTYITYAYDYQGRMIKKITDAETTLFYWNGNHIIAEFISDASQSSTNYFSWSQGETLTASLDGEMVFYCHDANKNVTDLVDDTGDLVAHYEYSPFGVITVQTGILAEDNPFRFSNEYWDSALKKVAYLFRFYDPWLGKFLSRDPIGVQGGMNLYGIGGNDLINHWDQWGLWLSICIDLGEDDVFEDWLLVHIEPVIDQQLVNNGTYFVDEFDAYWMREYKRKYCCCGKNVWRTGYSDKKIEVTADNDEGYPYYGLSNPMGVAITPTSLYSILVGQIGNATSFVPVKTDLYTQDQVRNRAMLNAPKDYEYGNIVAPKTKFCW